jgi:hypothetical protein
MPLESLSASAFRGLRRGRIIKEPNPAFSGALIPTPLGTSLRLANR